MKGYESLRRDVNFMNLYERMKIFMNDYEAKGSIMNLYEAM